MIPVLPPHFYCIHARLGMIAFSSSYTSCLGFSTCGQLDANSVTLPLYPDKVVCINLHFYIDSFWLSMVFVPLIVHLLSFM